MLNRKLPKTVEGLAVLRALHVKTKTSRSAHHCGSLEFCHLEVFHTSISSQSSIIYRQSPLSIGVNCLSSIVHRQLPIVNQRQSSIVHSQSSIGVNHQSSIIFRPSSIVSSPESIRVNRQSSIVNCPPSFIYRPLSHFVILVLQLVES